MTAKKVSSPSPASSRVPGGRSTTRSEAWQQWPRVIWLDERTRAGKYPTQSSLAEEFDVSPRTAANTVAFLRDRLGAPLRFSRKHGGYYYTEQTWALPTIFLTEAEAAGLLIAGRMGARLLGEPLAGNLERAIKKLCAYLPESESRDVLELANRIGFPGALAPAIDPQVMHTVQQAILRRRVLRLTYRSPRHTEPVIRKVEPHLLLSVTEHWLLVAWDRHRNAPRSFSLSRVQNCEVLPNEWFQRRPELTPEEYARHMFLTEAGDVPYDLTLHCDTTVVPFFQERQWHASQTIEPLSDGTILVRMHVSGKDDVLRWLLSQGGSVEVREPTWLRAEVEAAALEILRRYRDLEAEKY